MNRVDPSGLLAVAAVRWFDELSDRGVFVTDTDLIIRSWNPWLAASSGIAASAAIGKPLFRLYPVLEHRGFDYYYREVLTGRSHVLAERLHRHLLPLPSSASGAALAEMAQTARITPLLVGDLVVGTITVIEDVSDRVATERELRKQIATAESARAVAEEASSLKDEFLATLSHEIRTPLSAVLGWAHILQGRPHDADHDRGLEAIVRNATSQLRLVEDLLDMARIVAGKLQLEVQVTSFEEVVRAALDVVRHAAAARQIVLETSVEAGLPAIQSDPDRLQQVVWNLLSNAVKFTHVGGRVTVELKRMEQGIALTVADTGPGIAEEFLPFVFDRFRQADTSTGRRQAGLGLGLALVRQIVELHGGTVAAKNGEAGSGAVFTIRLPVSPTEVQTARRDALPPSPTLLRGVTIVVADDNDDGRDMLCTALRGFGAHVHAAASAAEALAILATGRPAPDVVVSDIGMPGTDGYALVRALRSSERIRGGRPLSAIALTAYANSDDRLRALEAGYDDHVPKPSDPARIADKIATLLRDGDRCSSAASPRV